MPRQTSTGKCNLCGETFGKAGMTRHLTKCRAEHPPRKGKPRKTFRLVVEGYRRPEYWMHLEMPADATLDTLDAFLRDIWLECCGHLSAFTVGHDRYELDTGGIDGMWTEIFGSPSPPQSMKIQLGKVLRPKLKFLHEYDFGTTTELLLTVAAEQEGAVPKNAVDVLARNDPPQRVCEKHGAKHKCGEEMLLPVVNSPRTGMCGYTGPLED